MNFYTRRKVLGASDPALMTSGLPFVQRESGEDVEGCGLRHFRDFGHGALGRVASGRRHCGRHVL